MPKNILFTAACLATTLANTASAHSGDHHASPLATLIHFGSQPDHWIPLLVAAPLLVIAARRLQRRRQAVAAVVKRSR
jgi:hypothetical protein